MVGVLRLPSGRLVRGRGLRRPLPEGPQPTFALYLLGREPTAQQIQRKGRLRPCGQGAAQSPAADEPSRRQPQHARHRGLPGSDHGASVAFPAGLNTGAWIRHLHLD